MRKIIVFFGAILAIVGTFIMMWKLLSLLILPGFPDHPSKLFTGSWTIYCFIGSYILYLLMCISAKISWRRFFGSIFRINLYYGLMLIAAVLLATFLGPSKSATYVEVRIQIMDAALVFLIGSLVFRLIAWKGKTRVFLS